jgi:hypothetical protein
VAEQSVPKLVRSCIALNRKRPLSGDHDTRKWVVDEGSEETLKRPEQQRDLLVNEYLEDIDPALTAIHKLLGVVLVVKPGRRINCI